jgi:hypothetical protein
LFTLIVASFVSTCFFVLDHDDDDDDDDEGDTLFMVNIVTNKQLIGKIGKRVTKLQ